MARKRRVIGFYSKGRGKKRRVHPITAKKQNVRHITMRDVKRIQAQRTTRARTTDVALTAKTASNEEDWAKHPNRRDLPGIDKPKNKKRAEKEKKE